MLRRLLAPLIFGGFVVSVTAGFRPVQAAPPLWQQLVPKKKVAADRAGDYTLAKEHGPWLILAASFSGAEGEQQARDLVFELRSQYNLPAFYYAMTFDLNDANPGRGIDGYGGRIKRRYQRGNQVLQHAVLAGEFPALEDPAAQQLLKRIKQLKPDSLVSDQEQPTAQSLAKVRQFHDLLRQKIGGPTEKGPMGHAFLTRNPLLPKEYFVPQGIDEEVAKWNKGLDYSLMKCPGKYSIQVATFKGRTSLKAANSASPKSTKTSDALVTAAENAHLLAVALREKGWEAYEFHDRYKSYVTVGSFDEGIESADGRITLNSRDAQIIINTFGAHTPNNIFNRPAPQDEALEQQQKQRFQNLLAGTSGQVANGFHPKRFVGLPFDIHPKPTRVPRRSISSAYARN